MALDTQDNQDYNLDAIDAIADGQMSAGQAVAIKNLENQIKQQILDTGEFSKEDKDRWLARIDRSDKTTATELQSVKQEIHKEKTMIGEMINKYVGTVNSNRQYFGLDAARKLDTAQQYIDEFKGLSLEEKTKWLGLLSNEIDGLKGLYETAKNLAPDAMDKFNTLRRSEKKNFIDELKNSRDGLKKLDEILGQNAAHLSPAEMEKMRVRMRDLPPGEHEKFLKEIVENEIKPRAAITEKFRLFPAELRKSFENFGDMTRAEREATIDVLTQNLSRDYRAKLFEGALSKHFSEQSKEQAYSWFVKAPLDMRVQALQMIESQMKFEEKQSFEFEDLINQLPKTTDPAKIIEMKRGFYESKYEDKVQKIKNLKEQLAKQSAEAKESEPIDKKYESMLDQALDDQFISEKTHERDLARFKKLKPEEKKADIEAFEQRLKPRKELTLKFQTEISQELQKEHGPDFYRRSYHGRMEKLEALLKLQKDSEGKVKENGGQEESSTEKGKTIEQKIKDLTVEASEAEGKDDYETALDCYDKILVLDPENRFAAKRATEMEKLLSEQEQNGELADMTDHDLEQLVKKAQGAEAILKARKIYTINHVLSDVTKASDSKLNKNRAADKTAHIAGKQDFAQIQEQLIAEHGMMLDDQGNAVKIEEINIKGYQEMDEGAIHSLGKKVAKIQIGTDEKKLKTHNFQANDGQKKIAGVEWAKAANDQEEALDQAVFDQAIKELNKSGKRLDDLTEQKLTKKVAAAKHDVKLAA